MLYDMVWYDEWEYLRLFAMVCYSNAVEWYSNSMLGNFNAMLCCERYTWSDCNLKGLM